MPDVTLANSNSNNGTTSPATTGSITAGAKNLLIAVYTVLGISPTIGTPTNWTQVQNLAGSTVSHAMFMLANGAGGATNPSSTLGGTVTGWVAAILEFPQTGANCGLQGSANRSLTQAAVTDIFNGQPVQTIPNLLFLMSIGRATNVFTPNFTGLGPSGTSGWSASVQPQVGVQGLSQDVYWGSNLAQGVGPWPTAPGTLASSAVWKVVGAWFNTTASQPSIGAVVSGNAGLYIPNQFQGMIGG
jgi:hypothetical protein